MKRKRMSRATSPSAEASLPVRARQDGGASSRAAEAAKAKSGPPAASPKSLASKVTKVSAKDAPGIKQKPATPEPVKAVRTKTAVATDPQARHANEAPAAGTAPSRPTADRPAATGEQAETPQATLPDWDRIARNMGRLIEEGGKAASAMFKGREPGRAPPAAGAETTDLFKTLGQVATHWMSDPGRMMKAQAAFSSQFVDIWSNTLLRFTGRDETPTAEPERPADRRFAAPEWHDNPVFDFLRRTYLMSTDWAASMVEEADSLDPATREKARFYLRQVTSALSPSNFLATNPELLRETFAEGGENLVRGMRMLAEDIEAGGGELKIRQSDRSAFRLGIDMAASPGKVVFRNELMELIQYAPATPEVLRQPLLIVPPWINKFYVLDLNPEKSFIGWAVAQGLTVFVISWVNPDERHASKGFEAYMREGIFAALDAIEEATGERDVATAGYCVGGTLLAVALAYMAAKGDRRVSSATFLTTQVDFRDAGDLKNFADEEQIRAVEEQMAGTGYLKGSKMAQAFNMLRPNELIWSYVVNNYIRGKSPMAFDLLVWNSDSTRMPAANHAFYLRNCYLGNKLTRGEMDVAGERLDLGKVTIPVYNLATREDHIAPARSVFTGAGFFGGPMRYVLSGSGHIAGVVNPPAKAKYQFWAGPPVGGSFADWLKAAHETKGSWWPDWFAWLASQAPEKIPARVPGEGRLPSLGDAPGEYVRVQS